MTRSKPDKDTLAAELYESSISSLTRAEKRLKTLPILLVEKDYTDVIQQTYEIHGYCLGALLHFARVDTRGETAVDALLARIEENLPKMAPALRKNFRRLRESTQKLVGKVEQNRAHVEAVGPVQHKPGQPRGESIFAREEAVRSMEWANRVVELTQQVIKDFDD